MAKAFKIQLYLCKKLSISNAESLSLIYGGKITINGKPARVNQLINNLDTIVFENEFLQKPVDFRFYKYYKPRGIECTLNATIPNALINNLKIQEGYTYAGRLDKESEGLLIITNDGQWIKLATQKGNNVEKVYEVEVNKPLNDVFKQQMENGIIILGRQTDPCSVQILSDTTFIITLKQGINRQIRRMCYKLGYEVITLKRIKFGNIELGNLKPGDCLEVNFK